MATGSLKLNVPERSPILRFDKNTQGLDKLREHLSALAIHKGNLWLGGDEENFIERLTREDSGNFGRHKRFDLAELLELPVKGERASEVDIEGMDASDGFLWLTGSHSLKREKAKENKSPTENLDLMARVEVDGNRFTLARLPLVKKGSDFEPRPVDGERYAARLEGDDRGNLLTQALFKDPHLAQYVPRVQTGKVIGIPSKENGFDVEGLAVTGNRIFLGCRGPVLRGWAVIIEIEVRESTHGYLELSKKHRSRTRYHKHFLQLEGLGIRELKIRNQDLYVLAAPTMDLDGPVFVYRWQNALDNASDSVVWSDNLQRLLAIPFGVGKNRGRDHAEGMVLAHENPSSIMVCYDSPAESRLVNDYGVRLDVFKLPRLR